MVEIWHRKQWMPTLNHSIYKQWAFVYPTTSIRREMHWTNQVTDKPGQIVHSVVMAIHNTVSDK